MFGFRTRIRAWLGVDALPRMENTMTTILTLLSGLAAQQQEASAAQQASFLNLHNAVDKLQQSVRDLQAAVADGDVSEDVQAAALAISENLDTMRKAAETADDGFEPVEPADDDALPEVPAETDDETPAVPAEDVPAESPDAEVPNTRRGR